MSFFVGLKRRRGPSPAWLSSRPTALRAHVRACGRRPFTALALIAAVPLLNGCGLHPLYAGGGSGPVARGLGAIEVGQIGGKNGWLVRNALTDRIRAAPQSAPRYRLSVELDDQILGFGVQQDNTVTRERRTLRARYKLLDAESGTVLVDATAGSDAGIDVVTSEYAVIAAEQTAVERLSGEVADQIVARLADYMRTEGTAKR